MVQINWITVSPPLLNSACAWSSDKTQLTELYESPHTGAVTTRSATLEGFKEDSNHTVAFAFDTVTSINSYGYSPHPLSKYLEWVEEILTSHPDSTKPFLISVAASNPNALEKALGAIQALRVKLLDNQRPRGQGRIAVELNTSCPNLIDEIPPGYDPIAKMFPLMLVIADAFVQDYTLTAGLKLPPYFMKDTIMHAVHGMVPLVSELDGERRSAISFVTTINTVGNALLPSTLAAPLPRSVQPVETETNSQAETDTPTKASSPVPNPDEVEGKANGDDSQGSEQSAPSSQAHHLSLAQLFPPPSDPSKYALPIGYGGLAGEAIHGIALGNVWSFRQLIDSEMLRHGALNNIKIIGVGGVTSRAALERMKMAGADAVACATFFGKEGVRAFEILSKDENSD